MISESDLNAELAFNLVLVPFPLANQYISSEFTDLEIT